MTKLKMVQNYNEIEKGALIVEHKGHEFRKINDTQIAAIRHNKLTKIMALDNNAKTTMTKQYNDTHTNLEWEKRFKQEPNLIKTIVYEVTYREYKEMEEAYYNGISKNKPIKIENSYNEEKKTIIIKTLR